MRLYVISTNNEIKEILECKDMFRQNGSFRTDFRHIFMRAVQDGHNVVFTPDNKTTLHITKKEKSK